MREREKHFNYRFLASGLVVGFFVCLFGFF